MQVIIEGKKKRVKITKEELIKSPMQIIKLSYELIKIFFSYKKKIKKISYLEVEGSVKEFLILTQSILKGVEKND